eukprot:4038953-Prymnesium_polylepis.1
MGPAIGLVLSLRVRGRCGCSTRTPAGCCAAPHTQLSARPPIASASPPRTMHASVPAWNSHRVKSGGAKVVVVLGPGAGRRSIALDVSPYAT